MLPLATRGDAGDAAVQAAEQDLLDGRVELLRLEELVDAETGVVGSDPDVDVRVGLEDGAGELEALVGGVVLELLLESG